MTPSVAEIEAMDRAALIAAWDRGLRHARPETPQQPVPAPVPGLRNAGPAERGGLPKGFVDKLQKAARR